MIARAPSRPRPIPFLDPLHTDGRVSVEPAADAPSSALATAGRAPGQLGMATLRAPAPQPPQLPQKPAPDRHQATPAPRPAGPATLPHRARRQVLVRHDGEHPVSVRSAATGLHYRFEACGGTQWVDAADVALLRRIAHMHLP